jgi:hypothetical protein
MAFARSAAESRGGMGLIGQPHIHTRESTGIILEEFDFRRVLDCMCDPERTREPLRNIQAD